MNSNDLKALMEAYSTVYQCEQDDELEEGVKGEKNSMRKLAAQERAAERKARGGAAPKMPGREGPSAGTSYADYQQVSIAAHDRASKKNKIIPGMAHEEVEIDEATALNREEFGLDQMVESLIERGHTEQEAYALVAQFTLDEAITSEKGKAKAAEMIAKRSTPSGRAKAGQGASVAAIKHISRANVDGYGGTPPNLKVAKNPVKSNFTGLNTGTGNKAARRAAALRQEEFVDEAQHARENPEKYEREQSKKYAPVRGEKTPMPPRGDKRREDFEKWYAKQMGR